MNEAPRLPRLFAAVARWAWRHDRSIVLAAGLLVLLAPLYLAGLRIDTDSSRLLPEDEPLGRTFREARALFGETSPLLLHLRANGVARDAFDEVTDRLASTLAGWEDIRLVESRRVHPADLEALTSLLRAGLWTCTPAEAAAVADRLTESGMRRQLLRSRKRLVAIDDPDLQELVVADILGLGEILLPQLTQGLGELRLSPASPYLESVDGDSRIIWVQPSGSGEDSAYCVDLIDRVEGLFAEVGADVPGARALDLGISGVHAITAESARILAREMLAISVLAAVLLLALLWLVFRDLRVTAVCVGPLLIAQLVILLAARLFFNPLFAWSIGYVAIAMGLGLDVVLHLAARYFAFRGRMQAADAVEMTLRDCGPPVTAGTLSTAAAFLAILLGQGPGLRQFALLTAFGLVATLVVTVLMFPALVRLLAPGGRVGSGDLLTAGWVRRMFGAVAGHPRRAAAASLLVIVVSLVPAAGVRLDTDIANLIPERLEAVDSGREIVRAFGGSFVLTTLVTLTAPTPESASNAQLALDRHLATLVGEGRLAGFRSGLVAAARDLPAPTEVRDRLQALSREAEASAPIFLDLLEQLGFADPARYTAYWDAVEGAFRPQPDRPAADQPGDGDALHFAWTRDGLALQSYVWPAEAEGEISGGLDAEAIRRASNAIRALPMPAGAELEVSGIVEVYDRVSQMVGSDLERISLAGAVLVCLVVLLFLRDLRLMLLSVLPLAAALPVTAALAVGLGVPVAHTAAGLLAVILGIGIDDAVHILFRLRASDGPSPAEVLREIGPVLTLTTLSTMIGFGCLALSSLPVLSSMGVLVALGVAACWFFSVFLLPAAAARYGRMGTRAAGAVVLGAVLLAPPAVAAGEPTVAELLSRLQARYQETEALSCEIEQEKRLHALAAPISLRGSILFMKPHFLKVELEGDENLTLICNGESVWLVDHDLGEVEELPFESGGLERVLPPGAFTSPADLETRFSAALEPSPVARHRLVLKPRAGPGRGPQLITVDLDAVLRIVRTEVVAGNGDTVVTRFAHWRRLDPVSRHVFSYRPPA